MFKLICSDMDGVIFEESNFWIELHKKYGTYEEGVELTKKYLKTDYAKLVKEVVGKLWKGKPESEFLELIKSQRYVPGAKELFKWLKENDYKTAIISSGPRQLAERAKMDLGIDYIYTNELVFKEDKVTGEFKWPIAADRKAVILRELCNKHNIDLRDCVVIVHDNADIKMARTAGFTIGFCPDNVELKRYCNIIINKKDLKEIIYALKDKM